jgi:hypothetical protein
MIRVNFPRRRVPRMMKSVAAEVLDQSREFSPPRVQSVGSPYPEAGKIQ